MNEVIDQAEAAKEASNDVTPQSGREVANAMIELSPSQFAFYTKAGVIDKMTFSTVDFQNAYNQIPVEPTTFREAYDHPDPEQQLKWREAIRKEF